MKRNFSKSMVLFIFIMHAMERDKMDFGGNKKPHQDKEINNNKEIYKKKIYIFFSITKKTWKLYSKINE